MVALRFCPKIRGLLFGLVLSSRALAEARTQAELSCVLDSGDLLSRDHAGRVEDPPWEGLASLRHGDENRARFALEAAAPGFLAGVTTSALLRGELSLSALRASRAPGLRDLSSSVAVSWRLASRIELTLRAFPFDTDYLRLGYLHALDWGGTDAERHESIFLQGAGSVPGVQLTLRGPRIRIFSALKWATVNDALSGEQRRWGVLFGGSAELLPSLRVDGGFGYFQRSTGGPSSASAGGFVEGASLRVVWHRGVDEPELSAEPFEAPPSTDDATRMTAASTRGLALAFEGVSLVQRRRRFEDPGAVSLEPAPAAALYGSARGHRWAGHAALTWRSLAFVVRNDPRLATAAASPPSHAQHAELAAWLGGSFTVRRLSLVPSLELGLRLPAAVETPSVLPGFGQTFVVAGPAGLEALPVGAARLPVVAARLGARFQASASVALSFFAQYQRDPNRVTFASSPAGVTRSFARPERLALLGAAQARF